VSAGELWHRAQPDTYLSLFSCTMGKIDFLALHGKTPTS